MRLYNKLNAFPKRKKWKTIEFHILASRIFKLTQDRNAGTKMYPISL